MEIPHADWLAQIELVGGEPAVDFVNSVADCVGPEPVEHLHDYPELLFWLRRCELLTADEAGRLFVEARRRPAAATAAFRRALRFRDAAWRALAATVREEAPAEADLAEVNRVVEAAFAHMRLVPHGERFRLARGAVEDDLQQALWPVARELAGFMSSDDLGALRMCASDTCGWLFVDRSRTKRRRWCRMDDCGNLAKQRRHRARQARDTRASVRE